MKSAQRQELKKKRTNLSTELVCKNSNKIIQTILSLDIWQNAKTVLLYYPISNEVDVTPLIKNGWSADKKVYLPCCRAEAGLMDFGIVKAEEDLTQGSYGIMEPCRQKCEFVDSVSPDIAIIPGVGFCKSGYRIGFGGGYYDRFLARDHKKNFIALGVCYDFQLINNFAPDKWDKPMNAICTEKEFLWIE